jgi:flavin-dependent dehydrogenase
LSTGCYDIAVVGGGPAGAVAGMVSAGLGLRTVVLEAATQARWKPGEVLAPECNPILKELGLWPLLAARPDLAILSAGVRSCWGSEAIYFRDGFCEPLGAGWIIDRRAFEMFLSQRARAAGADWLWGARVCSAERQESGWRIGSTGFVEKVVHARLVIDATGRPARLARRLGARRVRHQPQIVTVARWPTTRSQSDWIDIESVPDGWWYAATDPSGAQILACFGDYPVSRKSHETMRKAFAATSFLKGAFPLPPMTEPVHNAVLNAESTVLDKCGGDGWLAVGDAAAAFDPVASQGLSSALASANAAAHAAYGFLRGRLDAIKAYSAEMLAAYAFYLQGIQRHYRSERRWSEHPFWKIRHADPHAGRLPTTRSSK